MKSHAVLLGCALLLTIGFLSHATLRGDDVTGRGGDDHADPVILYSVSLDYQAQN